MCIQFLYFSSLSEFQVSWTILYFYFLITRFKTITKKVLLDIFKKRQLLNLAFLKFFWPFLICVIWKVCLWCDSVTFVHCKWLHKKIKFHRKAWRTFFESTFLFHNGISQNWFQMKEKIKRIQFLDCFEVSKMPKTV